MIATSCADMIVWAKDRLVDDLAETIADFSNERNYAARSADERREFRRQVARLVELLKLPESGYASLKALEQAGYWNGLNDTYFELFSPSENYTRKELKELKK